MLEYKVLLKDGKVISLECNGKAVSIEHFLGDAAWDKVNDIITLADAARQTRAHGYSGTVTGYNFRSFVYDRKIELGLIKERYGTLCTK